MFDLMKNFVSDESGAVTVDWVVLTGAVVGLGLLIMTVIVKESSKLSVRIGNVISKTISTE